MFEGIYPPLPTPFSNGEIAFEKLQENISKFNKTKLKGYVILGSNGEFSFLTREEKIELIKQARLACDKDKLIIAGTGSDSIKDTISLTEEAAKAGANAALILTPSYYKSQMKHKAIIEYFSNVAAHSPIPVLIYNVPKFTGIDIMPSTVSELAKHNNIIGIKNSSENIAHLMEIINKTPKNFLVLTGTGSVIYSSATCGAKGAIAALANVAPNQCVDVYEYASCGKFKEALTLQMKLLDLNKAVTATYGVAGLKKAMDLVGYFGGETRLPLLPLNESEISEIKSVVNLFLQNT